MQRQSNMQQVEAAHGQQQQFESRAPRGIFYNGTWYNTEPLQLPSCEQAETQWQQQYAHATLQPGMHLQQGHTAQALQLVVAEIMPQLPLQSSPFYYQLCNCQRGQPLPMLHGLHFMQPHQCEAMIKQQHMQQLSAQHIQTPLMQQLPQQFYKEVQQQVEQLHSNQQQPQHFIQQELELQQLPQHEQHLNQQQQCCYSTQVQGTDMPQQEIQQELPQQELQLQQQQHFIQQELELQQQHSNQQQLPQQQLQLELQQQQHFIQRQLESHQLQQHQQNSNQQQQKQQCCYSTQVEVAQSAQKEMQQQLPQQQLESQQLQQYQEQQCCYSTQLQQQQQLQHQLEHQTQSQQRLQQAQPQQQQQQDFVQQQLESQQLQQHQQDSNEQQKKKDLEQCYYSTELQQQPSHPQQQQQSVIYQQHYLADQNNNYRPQSSSTTPTSFPSSSSPSSISTPQPVNDPQIIELDMSSVRKVYITRTFARLVISIYRQTELDDEQSNRVIINGQVISSDDSSNGQSMSQLHVNSTTQTPTEEETQTETSMSTDASDEVDSSTADLEELFQYTTAAVTTVNQSKSNAQTEPEQFRAPRRVAKQQPMLQHNPLKKARKWTKPAKRIARDELNSPESNETLLNPIQQEIEQMLQENSKGIREKFEVVNSETILHKIEQVPMLEKESTINLQKVEQMQMQLEESGRVMQKIEQLQMPQKRSETILQKIEQMPLPEKESSTNLQKIKEKEMLQGNSDTILAKIEKMPQKSLEANQQKIKQIPIQQKDSGRIQQEIDEVQMPQKEPMTYLNNIKEMQMTLKKPETIQQKIEQKRMPQKESTRNVKENGQIQQKESGRVLQKIDNVEKPTTDKVQTISVTAKPHDSDSNNLDNLIKQTALGIASQQPQLALEICNNLGQQDREKEWPDLSVQQATPSVRLRKSQSSPQPIVNQKRDGMRSPPSFPDDYLIGEPKLPQSIYKQLYKRKSSQSKTIEQTTSMMTTKQETPLRSQSVDNIKRSFNTETYERMNHNSDECPQLNVNPKIRSPTRKNQSAQSSQSLVNQQKNLTRCQQGATKPTMQSLSKAQIIAVHQSDVNQTAARNDQVANQPKSSSNQASIRSTSTCGKAGNQKPKSTLKDISKEKSEKQSNVNQTVNLKSQSGPRFGLDESKTSKAITNLPQKESNGAIESNANQATDAKESEVHQSINLSADTEKPVKTFACSESENQSEVSLNPKMDNDTTPSTSQNAEAFGIRKTNNGRKQKTRLSKFERKALRRELQNVQLAARQSEMNSQSTKEVILPVEVHDVEEVKGNLQSTEVDQHLTDWEGSDEIKPKEEPKETEPSDEDPELNNPLLSGVSCKIMRGHILRIAKKINSL